MRKVKKIKFLVITIIIFFCCKLTTCYSQTCTKTSLPDTTEDYLSNHSDTDKEELDFFTDSITDKPKEIPVSETSKQDWDIMPEIIGRDIIKQELGSNDVNTEKHELFLKKWNLRNRYRK
ncbi:MAG: hypothetical protein ABII88_06705 [Candidatus Omnitrophota bacterium]